MISAWYTAAKLINGVGHETTKLSKAHEKTKLDQRSFNKMQQDGVMRTLDAPVRNRIDKDRTLHEI